MKRLLILILMVQTFYSYGQGKNVKTEIKAANIYELSIIQIYPDSFPEVSVVFQAKNKFGNPLWKLNKNEVSVTENGLECDVVNIKNISKDKPLNIGLVFDHSGSMFINPAQLPRIDTSIHTYQRRPSIPKNYVMAIEFGKRGINEFIKNIPETNDSLLFIGFSSKVDKVFPLTNNTKQIKQFVDSILPGGNTAFYDALILSMDSLSRHHSTPVIVALTDGLDNASKHNYKDVIKKAREYNISIYTIGLGGADEKVLKKIAKRTKGLFYYTNDPATLLGIYSNIKQQIRSIYELQYISMSTENLDKDKGFKVEFINDTLQFLNNSAKYRLSKEVKKYLRAEKKKRLRNNGIAGGVGIFILAFGSFVIYRRRKVKKQS